MKKFVALLLLFAFVCALAGCGVEKDTITIVLDWTPNTNHTGSLMRAGASLIPTTSSALWTIWTAAVR